jgi:hypothetical protein
MILGASNSGQTAQARYKQSGNRAMVRSSVSLAGGLDRLFNLGNNPLAPFRDVPEVLNTCQNEGVKINNDLDQQAVEQELQHYEEDGISKTMLPVEF